MFNSLLWSPTAQNSYLLKVVTSIPAILSHKYFWLYQVQPCLRAVKWHSVSTALSMSQSLWLTCWPWRPLWTIRVARWAWTWLEEAQHQSLTSLQTWRMAGQHGTARWSTFWPRWAFQWGWAMSGAFLTCARRTEEVRSCLNYLGCLTAVWMTFSGCQFYLYSIFSKKYVHKAACADLNTRGNSAMEKLLRQHENSENQTQKRTYENERLYLITQ